MRGTVEQRFAETQEWNGARKAKAAACWRDHADQGLVDGDQPDDLAPVARARHYDAPRVARRPPGRDGMGELAPFPVSCTGDLLRLLGTFGTAAALVQESNLRHLVRKRSFPCTLTLAVLAGRVRMGEHRVRSGGRGFREVEGQQIIDVGVDGALW